MSQTNLGIDTQHGKRVESGDNMITIKITTLSGCSDTLHPTLVADGSMQIPDMPLKHRQPTTI
ncbi:MAG: hypothetical protein QNJ78_15045, partial [Gammaproteobacteria bacterium]|nr:hypothetical protein [Gammaproteobacteria bacterium]